MISQGHVDDHCYDESEERRGIVEEMSLQVLKEVQKMIHIKSLAETWFFEPHGRAC